MPYLQVNDIKMNYHCYNAHTDRIRDTLIFVHGAGLNQQNWEPIVELFYPTYRIITFDIRGHGQTERGTAEIQWSTFLDDMDMLFKFLELDTFHLLGHGFGATLSIKYSLKHPDRIKSLICISLPAYYSTTTINAIVKQRRKLVEDGTMTNLAHKMAQGITNEPIDSLLYQRVVEAFCQVETDIYFEIFRLFTEEPPVEDYPQIKHPALSIVGDQDALYITTNTLTSRLLKNMRLRIVPDSSNATFLDQPNITVKWIKQFLNNPLPPKNTYLSLDDEHQVQEVMKHFSDIFDEGVKIIESTQTIQVDFLSSFRVIFKGEQKLNGWNQRYSKSILLFLILNPTTTREQICDALFPQNPIKQSMKNLKVYLNYLKKILDPSEENNILVMDKEHISLNATIVSDVISLTNSLKNAWNESDLVSKRKKARELLFSLPDILLAGIYDDWLNHYRNSLERQIVDFAIEMANIEEQEGRLHESINYLNIALKYQPENEWLYERSISLLAQIRPKKSTIKQV